MSMKEKLINPSILSGGQPFSPSDRANLLEVLQRCRRIETRLTRLLEIEGISTGIQRPWWYEDRIMVPSLMTTLDAIFKVIPEGWGAPPIQVVFKEDQQLTNVCRILLG